MENYLPSKYPKTKKGYLSGIPDKISYFFLSKEFMIIEKMNDSSCRLVAINGKELNAKITFDYISKYRNKFLAIEKETLSTYLALLKADYEEWATFSTASAQYLISGATILLSGEAGLQFRKLGDIQNEFTTQYQAMAASVVLVLFIMISICAPIVLRSFRKIGHKKSKAKLFIQLIEDILSQ